MAEEKASGQGRRAKAPTTDDLGSNLIEIGSVRWSQTDAAARIQFIKEIDSRYQGYLDELYISANLCVTRYQEFSKQHRRWRYAIIIGTGIVAIINLFAANKSISVWSRNSIPIGAAVCALILTILANLESFDNYTERAQAYRESRELFLDAARELERVWDVYVRPYGDEPEACINAQELYKRIAVKDRELRSKFKELTETKKKTSNRS